MPRTP